LIQLSYSFFVPFFLVVLPSFDDSTIFCDSAKGFAQRVIRHQYVACTTQSTRACIYKKAQLTQGLRATALSLQDGRQPPSWILSNRK